MSGELIEFVLCFLLELLKYILCLMVYYFQNVSYIKSFYSNILIIYQMNISKLEENV